MKTLTLDIEETFFDEFIILLKSKYKSKVNIVEDDIFSDEDNSSYLIALQELKNGEAISLKHLKEELNV